jgi:hypothetical protein
MKIRLRINKRGVPLYEGIHEVIDQDSFGKAFADIWLAIREKRMEKTTSVGELMDILNDEVLEQLHGAEISVAKL